MLGALLVALLLQFKSMRFERCNVHLQSKLCEVVYPVFPYPVYPFSRFVPKIAAVEISTEEEIQLGAFTVGFSELVDFDCFLFPPFVDIREIACRLCLDEHRHRASL